jgi:peptidyl-tRNA hydrolase, PTH1 family
VENLYLIAGLGNPGTKYAETRHNVGFMVLERLSSRWGGAWKQDSGFKSRLARCEREGRRVLLCQPQTYMNASGEAVGATANFFRLPPEQVLVVLDDADLPFGHVRMRPEGSSGGHHGLESIEQHLGTRQFPRLRIGIGRKEAGNREITDYVLGRFAPEDREDLEKVLTRAADQVECWLLAGIDRAMNQYNGAITVSSRTKENK